MLLPLSVMLVAASLMLAFAYVRRLELARGARFFESERARLDARVTAFVPRLVLGGVPLSWRAYLGAIAHDVTHLSIHGAVEAIRAIERPLAKLSYKLRISAPRTGAAPVSEFLKTITPERAREGRS
ncbi:hypothetical protein KGO06_01500 [Patescibacteria group bacterium]|nr:hypothetical protein [Patescibacteria group bacterium]